MLRALDIAQIGLIDRLSLAVGPGLTVLTGETGAGKSILLDALGFALGWKGRGGDLRPGAERGEVTAVFALPEGHPARAVLAEADLPVEEELILRRVATADGRRQAYVNDRRAGADTLRTLGDLLVELHGQHDDRGLMDARGHRALLDAFAGAAPQLARVRAAWTARQAARVALAEAEAARDEARKEEDWLRHAASELAALAPEPGEEAALDAERRRLQAGTRIRDGVAQALALLGPDGAERPVAEAARRLAQGASAAEGLLDESLTALDRARDALAEAEAAVAAALDRIETDPAALERIEERLFALRAAHRKYRCDPEALPGLAADMAARVAALEASDTQLPALRRAVSQAEAAHLAECAVLSAARTAAAAGLERGVAQELPPLKLDRARFAVSLSPLTPGPEGADQVVFTVATGPGLPQGPLDRIASGGELSRFLLALKVALADPAVQRLMIFDEIDRGVGGATADAVGRRLAQLASGGGQVLTVTHSPQVAALGDQHWRIEKTVEHGATLSRVQALTPEGRIDEIARMLAGDAVTEAARAAARALLGARAAA